MENEEHINLIIFQELFPAQNKNSAKIDSLQDPVTHKNLNILELAYNAWQSLEKFRKEAERCAMYTFGNQWGDYITTPNGHRITEEQYIKHQGKIPLKNNLIRSLVRSVLGQFSNSQTESICTARDRDEQQLGEMMTATIQSSYERNQLWELDRRNLESFLITGAAFFKTTYGWREDTMDVWTDSINYHRIFFDPYMEDPRHIDCNLIGEIHDISLNDLLAHFAGGSREKAMYLKEIYKNADIENFTQLENLCGHQFTNLNFFIPENASRCRVIEIWRKETKERLRVHDFLSGEWYKVEIESENELIEENNRRIREQTTMGITEDNLKLIRYEWFIDRYWYYRFLSPFGDVLAEGETPYWHKSHPYSFKIYPFFDAISHSFVADAIDQNRYINRLITLQDFILGSSAKGVLMFPESAKPTSMSMEEIAQEWTSYNGIIYYKPLPGVTPPQQIITNTSQTGAYQLLDLQLQLFKDTTGVYSALQGQQPASGTPASLYAQQTQNSATNLVDIFETYRQLRENRDTKIMKLQQQYYTETRYLNINGKNFNKSALIFNPDKVRNTEFYLSITESVSTPVYRIAQNELLIKLLEMGQINVEMLLENGAFPFADSLLQSIKNFKAEIANQQQQLQAQQTLSLQPVQMSGEQTTHS